MGSFRGGFQGRAVFPASSVPSTAPAPGGQGLSDWWGWSWKPGLPAFGRPHRDTPQGGSLEIEMV